MNVYNICYYYKKTIPPAIIDQKNIYLRHNFQIKKGVNRL